MVQETRVFHSPPNIASYTTATKRPRFQTVPSAVRVYHKIRYDGRFGDPAGKRTAVQTGCPHGGSYCVVSSMFTHEGTGNTTSERLCTVFWCNVP